MVQNLLLRELLTLYLFINLFNNSSISILTYLYSFTDGRPHYKTNKSWSTW